MKMKAIIKYEPQEYIQFNGGVEIGVKELYDKIEGMRDNIYTKFKKDEAEAMAMFDWIMERKGINDVRDIKESEKEFTIFWEDSTKLVNTLRREVAEAVEDLRIRKEYK